MAVYHILQPMCLRLIVIVTYNYLYNVGPCSRFHMHFQISSQVSCVGSELVASF